MMDSKQTKIVVVVIGGCVTRVFQNNQDDVEVIVRDFDDISADDGDADPMEDDPTFHPEVDTTVWKCIY